MHGVRLKPFKCIRIISHTNWKLLTHRAILYWPKGTNFSQYMYKTILGVIDSPF
jgi:hypothetical protein